MAEVYAKFFNQQGIEFVNEPENCTSNYWLNTLILEDKAEQSSFLEIMNNQGIMVRPIWQLMNRLEMYKSYQCDSLESTYFLADRGANMPSSVM
jgi:perosamine synthetase